MTKQEKQRLIATMKNVAADYCDELAYISVCKEKDLQPSRGADHRRIAAFGAIEALANVLGWYEDKSDATQLEYFMQQLKELSTFNWEAHYNDKLTYFRTILNENNNYI